MRVSSLPWLVACALLIALPAHAENLELPFWSQNYQGSIAGKTVKVRLIRLSDRITGNYCYLPCSEIKEWLWLKGELQPDGQMTLKEINFVKGTTPNEVSGQWQAKLQGDQLNGDWQSPDGQRHASLQLQQKDQTFPYEIRLLASGQPKENEDCDSQPLAITAIRLYDKGQLLQELAANSQSTCTMFLPEIVDSNFDGQSDLMLATAIMPAVAGPNIAYQFWLYEPQTRKFSGKQQLKFTLSEFDAFTLLALHNLISKMLRSN